MALAEQVGDKVAPDEPAASSDEDDVLTHVAADSPVVFSVRLSAAATASARADRPL
jgi:hypothetical protein